MSPKFSSQVLLLCIKWVSQFRECASYRGQQRQLRDTTQDGAVLAFIEGEPRVGGRVRRQQSKEQADRRWELILGCHGENLGFLGGGRGGESIKDLRS